MRSFNSLEAFGSFLVALSTQVEDRAAHALREGAHLVAEDAQERIGHYDGNDWPQLAAFTQAERERLGFSANDPLLRSGTLHDAIVSEGQGREAVAGVKSGGSAGDADIGDIALWQEMGTPDAQRPIPPRPFLGPAGFTQAPKIAENVANAAADAFIGKV